MTEQYIVENYKGIDIYFKPSAYVFERFYAIIPLAVDDILTINGKSQDSVRKQIRKWKTSEGCDERRKGLVVKFFDRSSSECPNKAGILTGKWREFSSRYVRREWEIKIDNGTCWQSEGSMLIAEKDIALAEVNALVSDQNHYGRELVRVQKIIKNSYTRFNAKK